MEKGFVALLKLLSPPENKSHARAPPVVKTREVSRAEGNEALAHLE